MMSREHISAGENAPLLSVVVPVYNQRHAFEKCLESICHQTYRQLEIICIDDGSTDGAEKIVDEFAKKDDRIVAIYQKNAGESSARNSGLRLAQGDYIAFVDCDDWLEPDMYQKMMDCFAKYQVDIVASSWFREEAAESIPITNAGKVKAGILSREDFLHYIYQRDSYQGFAYMWDKLYKRDVLTDETGQFFLFDETLKLGGDVVYLAQIALKASKVIYMEKSFYHYRQRSDSGSHAVNIHNRMDWLRAYQIVIAMFEANDVDEMTMKYVKRFLAYHSSNAAEIAKEQNERQCLDRCLNIMTQYQKEYEETNTDYPQRIERYRRILAYGEGTK